MASHNESSASTSTSTAAAETSTNSSKVRLQANDGTTFTLDVNAAKLSKVVKQMIEDLSGDRGGEVDLEKEEPIPLPNVSGPVLSKIVTWMEYHWKTYGYEPEKPEDDISHFTDEISDWDKEFMKVDQGTMFEFLVAANYLNIKKFKTIVCKTIAEILKKLSVEEIREKFGIINDFTPEEEEVIRKENEWCEDQEPPKA